MIELIEREKAKLRAAFTIDEFCERNAVSSCTYFKLRALGLGPQEMRIGAIVRITASAELEWQRARSNPVGEEARAVEAKLLAGRRKAQRAVRATRHAGGGEAA